MSDAEINFAIAEAVGLKIDENCQCGESRWHHVHWRSNPDSHSFSAASPLPNYCDDLNAMHEAEKCFDGKIADVQSLYYDYLGLVVGWGGLTPAEARWKCTWNSFRATARQRAEAFLRTLGKWQDSPQPSNPAAESQQASRSPSTSVGGGIL